MTSLLRQARCGATRAPHQPAVEHPSIPSVGFNRPLEAEHDTTRRPVEAPLRELAQERGDVWLEAPATASKRFDVEDPAAMEHLERHGYVVLRAAADTVECQRSVELLWEFLGESTAWQLDDCTEARWSRGDPSSWDDDGLARFSVSGVADGTVNKQSADQAELAWFVRTLPRVRRIFEMLWETQDLITSFDSFGLFRPWHHGFMKTLGGWYHVDQGPLRPVRQDARTCGLTSIPQSPLRCESGFVATATDSNEYIPVPESRPLWQEPHRIVQMGAGDFVLWDSRYVHCNAPAMEPSATPADRLLRAVVYVCITPKSRASEETLEKRRKGYENDMATTHWPYIQVMGFGYRKVPPKEFETFAAGAN